MNFVLSIAHLLFLLMLAYLFISILKAYWSVKMEYRFKTEVISLSGWIVFLFIVGMIYQAYWQLFGHLNPELSKCQFMYDKRPETKSRIYKRGTIFDGQGRILAEDVIQNSGTIRRYILGEKTGHILGYKNYKYGKSGLEGSFDTYLMGSTAKSSGEIFRLIRNGLWRSVIIGNDLMTTIDFDLQTLAYDLLANNKGAIIVLNPQNGQILAMASYPSFNPQNLSDSEFEILKKREDSPFLNRAIQGLYPPGSLFKVIDVAAAIEHNISPRYKCEVEYIPQPGADPIRDHEFYEKPSGEWKGYGMLDINKALVVSSNVYFARLGNELGIETLYNYATRFGFNQNISLFNDTKLSRYTPVAISTFPRDMGRSKSDEARVALGQSKILATPLQMALIYAAIANGGKLIEPRIRQGDESSLISRPINEKTAETLKKMLVRVVEDGTGASARIENLNIAGKTGSAENPHGKAHSWFVCFAPAENPQILVLVLIENGGYGAEVAAPLAKKLLLFARRAGYLSE